MKLVISEPCYKGTILQRQWSFYNSSFVKIYGELFFWSHNKAVLYPIVVSKIDENPCKQTPASLP